MLNKNLFGIVGIVISLIAIVVAVFQNDLRPTARLFHCYPKNPELINLV